MSIITLVQLWIVTYNALFEDGDGILTVEEYKAAFHEHGVFVGRCENQWEECDKNFNV